MGKWVVGGWKDGWIMDGLMGSQVGGDGRMDRGIKDGWANGWVGG